LALLGLCNSVIANRALPRCTTIDEIIDEYARIVIGGVVVNNGLGHSGIASARGKSEATH
jgi:hypothetical protein